MQNLLNYSSTLYKTVKANFIFILFLLFWILSFIVTDDQTNWLVENLLVFIFLPILFFSKDVLKISKTSYLLIFLFLLMHIIGSIYAYASVPIGNVIQSYFHLLRNPYDRIVHFCFGLLMAYPILNYVRSHFKMKTRYTYILPIEIILSLSAVFELIEWIVGGVLMAGSEETYVGSQGDIWDAQKDMALAWLGAIIAMMITFGIHKISNKQG